MMKQVTLEGKNLQAGYDKKIILKDASVSIPNGKISVIIGANASGKSTLLKTLARLIHPLKGQVLLSGEDIHKTRPKKVARTLGLMPQSPIVPEGILVSDLVARGRFPYQTWAGGMSDEDHEAVAEALEIMGITELADRCLDELSGGQRQRVWIAMALAQQTEVLLLDEPTTFLDIAYQVEILDLLTDLNRRRGTTIVMVLHEINLSVRYADHLFVVKNGQILAEGPPSSVVTETLIEEVYGIASHILTDPMTGAPMMIPVGRHHMR